VKKKLCEEYRKYSWKQKKMKLAQLLENAKISLQNKINLLLPIILHSSNDFVKLKELQIRNENAAF